MKFKKNILVLSTIAGLTIAGPTQAGWFDDAVSWVETAVADTVDWVEGAVGWVDTQIIDPVEDAFGTVWSYTAYLEVVEDTMTDVGYSSSGGAPFRLPTTTAGTSGTIKVMSYNVLGFPEVIRGISDDQARSASSLLESWDFDIVGLQENWVINGPLMSNLSTSTYPGRTHHYGGTMTSFGDGLVTIAGGAIDPNQAQRIQFNLCDGTLGEFIRGEISSPDCATEKGFTIAEVHLASDLSVHVYNTHFNTGSNFNVNQGSLDQIANKINTYSAGKPVVLMGDFNMWLTDSIMAAQFSEFTAKTGLTWSCEDLNTCDGRIDLIAYRGSEQFDFTTLSEATIDDNGISDHAPRAATLHWENNGFGNYDSNLSVSFKGIHGDYFVSEGNGGGAVNANRSAIGAYETFTLNATTNAENCMVSGDEVNIKSADGYYWSAQSSGELDGDRTGLGSWEKFRLINHTDASGCLRGGDSISLMSTAHGKFVVAENYGSANANRTAIGSYEKIEVVVHSITGQNWSNVPGYLEQVSIAADGSAWGVDGSDAIYRRDGSSWTSISGYLKQISVGSASKIWGVNSGDYIYRWNGNNWENIPGRLKHVSVAADGTVWGVNASDNIYRWNGSSWTQISGGLKQISVGSANEVWGINAGNQVYQWNGSSWTQITGTLIQVDVAADGSVWGVDRDYQLYVRSNNSWQQVSGTLKQISVGSGNKVWGIDRSDAIYFRNF